MDILLIFEALFIFLLLLFSGFFSGSETALFSLSLFQRENIRKHFKKKAEVIDRLLSQPRRLIVTILIGNDMVNITASVAATFFFIEIFNEHGKWIAVLVMTPLTLIFAEIIPKTVSITYNKRIAAFVARPIEMFSVIIAPLRWLFDGTANIFMKFTNLEKKKESAIIKDDFLDMVDLSHKDGELQEVEKDIIHNVFEFKDAYVFEVMTPLKDVFCLSENTNLEDTVKYVKKNPFSRVPVYKNKIDNIAGILYIKDLLKIDNFKENGILLSKIIRRAFFIQETTKVDELFNILKLKRKHIAICLDELGNVTGLVTMEDLLEELFGEIYDEYDLERVWEQV